VPIGTADLDEDGDVHDRRIVGELLRVVESLASRARSDGAQSSLSPGRHN
jgi:hypothetical protein